MPAVNILIKPASSACNMNCSYCFYKDVADNREISFEGMLSLPVLEKIISSGMEYAEGICSFAFQGGEPTLAGLDFYRQVVELQKRYARPGIRIHNAIQTNGLCIDEEWASFLSENHFLTGLSLDGPKELHDRNRTDVSGKGTWERIMNTVALLKRYQVEYNILCVVTGQNARSIPVIYQFYKDQGFHWLQFIPCLEPLGAERGCTDYYLSPKAYGNFLIRIFDLWYEDLKRGKYISIRHLDNWLWMLLGEPPEACNMAGHCSIQFVVEGDGGIYPCDFYVLDEWKLGTAGEQSFQEILASDKALRFCSDSRLVPQECQKCSVYSLCRNGCRRDRLLTKDGLPGQNYYCESYQRFFSKRHEALLDSVRLVRRMRR